MRHAWGEVGERALQAEEVLDAASTGQDAGQPCHVFSMNVLQPTCPAKKHSNQMNV